MIDIHCHILPGLDDGAADVSVAEYMLAAAATDGIDTVICTPHSSAQAFSGVDRQLEDLTQRALAHGIRLFRGMEYRYAHLCAGKPEELCTLAGTSFLLVELASSSLPPSAGELFFALLKDGKQIVIAHPERNLESLDECAELERIGVFFQLNCDSILGGYGSRCRRMAFRMIEKGFCHYIASDAHGRHRAFRLSECRRILVERYGEEFAGKVLLRNPQRLLENRMPEKMVPVRRGGFFRRIFNWS